jgi:ribosomal protein L32
MSKVFLNPKNGYRVEIGFSESILAFIFGALYYLYRGLWHYLLIWFIVVVIPFSYLGESWLLIIGIPTSLVMALLLPEALRSRYLERGWIEEGTRVKNQNNLSVVEAAEAERRAKEAAAIPQTRKCPECAELILAEAKKCKHCGSQVEPLTQQPISAQQQPQTQQPQKVHTQQLPPPPLTKSPWPD